MPESPPLTRPHTPAGQPTPRQIEAALGEGRRAVVLGLVLSALLAAAKIGAGAAGNAYVLIADGFESVFDLFNGLLVWGGLRLSGAPPTPAFPYGRGKAEPLAALAVATLLLAAAAGIAAGAVSQIVVPHRVPAPFTLPVLVGVVLVKEATYRILVRKGRALGSHALETDAWHHRSDALTSLAAFLGIGVALFGGPGYESADDWAALAACLVIAWNAGRLLRGAARQILDAAAPREVETRIRDLAASVPGVLGIDDLRVRRSGFAYWVDIHVEVDGHASVRLGHDIAHRVKSRLIESELPVLDALVHVEPAHEPLAPSRLQDGEG